MSKHTPGPWFLDEKGNVWRRHPALLYQNGGSVAGDHPIATVFRGHPTWEKGFPVEANARLIAAAPDLLEALEVLFADYKQLADSGDAGNWRLEDMDVGKVALAAIARAKGEQP